jgi:excisionase family DNA binding protein
MTLDEVAQRLGVSKRTVMRWSDQSRHCFPKPRIRNGHLITFRDEDIEQYLIQERRKGNDDAGNKRTRPSG